jgi:serine/threonine-protein kinase ATR
LAKFHGKTPYKLLDPYISEIARYLIAQWLHQPGLLLETCRFVSQEPSEFISGTLVHTLPLLFANRNKVVIEKIAQNLGFTPSTLFLDFSKDVLTQVFLLPDQVQTVNALDFILQLMPTPSGGSINAQTLARSCIIELLGTFVFMLGSEDSKKVQEVSLLCDFRVIKLVTQGQAMRGLHRLESILPSSKGRKKVATSDGVGKFLKSHLLGLISYLVEKLQGIQGRETMASKQQTLRGLGALITHVGMEISIVAPQVSKTSKVLSTRLLGLNDSR